jgi:hypothetical protein
MRNHFPLENSWVYNSPIPGRIREKIAASAGDFFFGVSSGGRRLEGSAVSGACDDGSWKK